MPNRSKTLLAATLAAMATACTPNVVDARAKGAFDVPEGVTTVRITLEKGGISVNPSDDGRIHYEAAVRKGTTDAVDLEILRPIVGELTMSREGGELRLDGPRVPSALMSRDPGAAVVMRIGIRVPPELHVILRTERGPLGVRKRSGDVDLHTKAGDIKLDEVRGNARTFTGSGNHLVTNHSGSGIFATEHGNYVAYFLQIEPENGISIRTKSGNIQCNLPLNSSFDLRASSGFGEIETSLPVERVSQGKNGMTAFGPVGDGGPTVELEVGRGNISVRAAARQD